VTNVSDGLLVAEYGYDYRGLRVLKRTPQGLTRYHWDGYGRLVRESDEAGNTLALYVWNTANQLAALQKGGQWYYPHTNARGDILSVTDAAGNRVAAYEYGPWGELLSASGTLQQPWRYAGYYYDTETGLYYLKARYYNSELGRFTSADHASLTPGDFLYAADDPLNYVDSLGEAPDWPSILGGRAFEEWVRTAFGYVKNNAALIYGKYIPDGLRYVKGVLVEIIEVKDWRYLPLTKQLRAMMGWAKQAGVQMRIIVRQGTRLSKPLLEMAQKTGTIIEYLGNSVEVFPMVILQPPGGLGDTYFQQTNWGA